MVRKIGERQRWMLQSMIELGRTGKWRIGIGWSWITYSETEKIMFSLQKRGLVKSRLVVTKIYGPVMEFTITKAGRIEAANRKEN